MPHRGSALDNSIKKKALDLEHLFLFMSAAKAVRTWRNDTITYRKGPFYILPAPVISCLAGSFENAKFASIGGMRHGEITGARSIMSYRIRPNYAHWALGDFSGFQLVITGIFLKQRLAFFIRHCHCCH